jgi:hypothetical protein
MSLDCPTCAGGDIEHAKESAVLTMTNDEAQEWLLAQHNAAPGPPDPARFGAAIRAIRAAAMSEAFAAGEAAALERVPTDRPEPIDERVRHDTGGRNGHDSGAWNECRACNPAAYRTEPGETPRAAANHR